MPTHEERGDLVRMYMKAQMRQGGRYQKRALYDTHVEEGEDLWTTAALESDHPMRMMKNSIASLTSRPYQAVVASIPSATYKNAATAGLGHSYELQSVALDWGNKNTDDQSTGTPLMTKLEQTGLMQMKHQLPPRWEYDDSGTQGAQAIMRPSKKIKTHYALGGKNTAAAFNDGRRNWTDLHTLKTARGNYNQNRGVAGRPSGRDYLAAQYDEKRQATGIHRVFDEGAMTKFGRALHHLDNGRYVAAARDTAHGVMSMIPFKNTDAAKRAGMHNRDPNLQKRGKRKIVGK